MYKIWRKITKNLAYMQTNYKKDRFYLSHLGQFEFFKFHLKSNRYTITWIMKMIGIPYLKEMCNVLWHQNFIPIHAPMLPPKSANKNKQRSLIRQLPFLAFHLSIPKQKNVVKLMINKYQ